MDELSHPPRARLEIDDDRDSAPELMVRLGGDLDLAGITDIAAAVEELLARQPQPVLLDLAEVDFCDSSGVALLIRLTKHFGEVRMRAAPPPVHRVIQTLGLADWLGLDGA